MKFKIKLNKQHFEKTADEIRALIKEIYLKKHNIVLSKQELDNQLKIILYLLQNNNDKNMNPNKKNLTNNKLKTVSEINAP